MVGLPEEKAYERVYNCVRQIPAGRVATYGQIGRLAGGFSGRMVGFALAALRSRPDGDSVPWQRVVNATGRISTHGIGGGQQRALLEEEGVTFSADGSVKLDEFLWEV